jgi:hypothetical protein
MKKTAYILITLSLAFFSCASEPVVEQPEAVRPVPAPAAPTPAPAPAAPKPAPAPVPAPAPDPAPAPEPPEPEAIPSLEAVAAKLDPADMSGSYADAIKPGERMEISPEQTQEINSEISQLVTRLNSIISNNQFTVWKTYLDPHYEALLANPAYLREISNIDRFKMQRIMIGSVQDYFTYVVKPSRQNIRISDIDIFNPNRAIVYTVKNGEKLRVYDLAKGKDGWKIIN